MSQAITEMAHEVFPPSPDRIAFYPAESRQSVLAALRDDVEAGRHLLCVTGDAGSGKTVLLRELRRRLQGSIGLIEQPVPNQLLRDVARSLGLDTSDQESEPILRRRMVMQLALAEQRRQPIVLIVDDADRLPKQDIELLLHFFPPGHATLVLAGEAPPQDWLDLCVMAAGPVRADAVYRLEPLTVEEAAGYLRHRLRAAGLPEDLFRADAAEAIHRQGGGLPGRIHRLSADVLVQAALHGDDNVTAPAVERTCDSAPMDPEPAGDGAAAAEAPLLARRRRSARPLRPLVAPSAVRLAGEPRTPPARRLRRSVWRWRAAAVLAGIALVAVLVRDLPTGAALSARLADLLAVREAPERTADGPVRPRGTEHADAPAQASADTEAWENDAAEFAALSAPPSQSASAADPAPSGSAAAPARVPTFDRDDHRAARAAEPALDSAADSAAEPPASDASASAAGKTGTPSDGTEETREESVAKQAPVSTEPEAQAPASDAASTPLTSAQRREVARLYAQRAEYEWRNGDLAAAAVSVGRGLDSDPGNPQLLALRARLRQAMSGR